VRLVKNAPLLSNKPICSPEDAVELLGKYMCELDREVLCMINLRTDGMPINCNFVSMGAVNESIAHPREIFKSAILSNATSMIIIHNHPSGKLEPSKNDTMTTDRILKLCELMGIPLVDHIIVGGDNQSYFSFKEKDILNFDHSRLETDYKKIEYQRYAVTEPSAVEFQSSEDVDKLNKVVQPRRHRHR
jgi:DNA repair protein RadC